MKTRTSLKAIAVFLVIALSVTFFFFNPVKKNNTETSELPKQLMLEEMFKQWKEMLQDPNGEIPTNKGYAAWRYAGDMMKDLQAARFDGLIWQSRGPNNVGGRTRSLLVSPNDATGNTVFAGSVGGGLWKSTNMRSATPDWTPVNDFMENLAIATLAYDPGNTQIFYAGTGEGFNSADAARGNGIMKSVDGGNTWNFLSSTQNSSFYYVNKIVVTSNGIIVAATNSGIRRSTDGGNTWTNPLGGAIGDVEKAANGVLFAATKNGGSGVYRSLDNGVTWSLSSSGLPTGLTSYSRYEVGVAPSDANRAYVMVYDHTASTTRIYKTTDGGSSWTQAGTPSDADGGISSADMTRGQGWYDLIIKVDPNNADVVYTGGIDIFKSTNGATSWSQITHWYGGFGYQNVHADQHFIEFEGNSSSVIYFTNDGGVYQTTNGTASVPTITAKNKNYNVTQFYAGAVHPSAGSNFFLAGAQDNGTQRFTQAGFGSTTQASGGDGAYCNIDQLNPTYMFSQYVYNNYYRSTNGGSSFSSVSNSFSSTGRFINPTRYDDNTKELYAATSSGKFLRWNNANTGNTFQQITVSAMGTQTVSAVTVSPVTADRVYFGTGNGQIIEVDNASTVSGTIAGRSLGTPNSGYLNCIWQNPDNGDHMMVVYTGFGRANIYETFNASAASPTWSGKDGNLPDMPVFWILPEPGSTSSSVLIATEYGVWSTENFNTTSPSWIINSNGLSRCRVTQLYFRENDNTLTAMTYGRGLFTTTFVPGNSCAAPSSLSTSGVTASSATISWGTVSGATNYDVDYKTSAASVWANAATGTTNTSISLSSLSPSTVYDWRVRTNCAEGSSSYSQAQFTTSAACGTPGGLTANNITTSSATVSWSAVANALDYSVEYKLSTASTWSSAITGTISLSYNLTGLSAASTYNWRVTARCSAGIGTAAQSSFNTAAPTVCNDAYEANNTSSKAKTISIGTTINANIGSSSDVDWFKITTPNNSNTNLKVTLSNLPEDYDLYVYNKSLILVGSSTNTGTGNEIVIYNTTAKRATYYIKVQSKSGAFTTSQCYSLIAQVSSSPWSGTEAGIQLPNENQKTSFRLYPNPASDILNIELNSQFKENTIIELYSTNGQKVLSKSINISEGNNRFTLPVSTLRKGVYILQLKGYNNLYTQKVIIE